MKQAWSRNMGVACAGMVMLMFAGGWVQGAPSITYDAGTTTYTIMDYTSGSPCTLEDLYLWDQASGPSLMTKNDHGTHYEYVVPASIHVGGSAAGVHTYFQIGFDNGTDTKNHNEVLNITGDIYANWQQVGFAHIDVGDEDEKYSASPTINPTIQMNPSSDNEYIIYQYRNNAGKISYYNATLESNTAYRYTRMRN